MSEFGGLSFDKVNFSKRVRDVVDFTKECRRCWDKCLHDPNISVATSTFNPCTQCKSYHICMTYGELCAKCNSEKPKLDILVLDELMRLRCFFVKRQKEYRRSAKTVASITCARMAPTHANHVKFATVAKC